MDYVLTTGGLTKRYRHCKALDGLTMHVPRGAIYGLVGKNGAGKTTLIRLICGLQAPTAGSCTLYGRESTHRDIRLSRRRMGAVVETPSIYLDMTAEENLKEQFRVLGLPSDEGAEDLLELVGLSDTGKKKAKNFSLGMKQRLGIAVALAGDPDFLVLDEPVNGLDPEGIVEIRELILKLNREKQITVLISSHILDELSRLATHYGFIDHGRMVKEISAKELMAACRKCVRLTVSDVRPLARVLDAMGLEYTIWSDTMADVYAAFNITELTLALAKENCEVLSMKERDESLESYYINLVGVSAMRDLLRANTYRLPRSGAFRVCTLAVALLSVYVCVNQKLESAAYDFVVNVDKLVFGFPVVLIGPALAIFTCFFVGVEYSDGVVRNKLTTGHSRGEVYLANFITCVEVGVFLELVSMALLAALGGPLFGGFQMEPGLLAMALLNSLLLTVCWAALFNMLAMLISNRTVNAVVSVLLVVLLFMAAVAILETLQAPEFVTSGEFIDGQVVLSELPNPRYLLPEQRAPYEWAMCLLPTGQVLGIAGLAAPYPIRMVMIALAETVLFDLVGLWGFRRKDLK